MYGYTQLLDNIVSALWFASLIHITCLSPPSPLPQTKSRYPLAPIFCVVQGEMSLPSLNSITKEIHIFSQQGSTEKSNEKKSFILFAGLIANYFQLHNCFLVREGTWYVILGKLRENNRLLAILLSQWSTIEKKKKAKTQIPPFVVVCFSEGFRPEPEASKASKYQTLCKKLKFDCNIW